MVTEAATTRHADAEAKDRDSEWTSRRFARCCFVAVLVIIGVAAFENLAIAALFPNLPRLTTDFSPTYLERELMRLKREPQATIFLGDSVLWGYRLPASEGAVSLLTADGCRCENLAFKGGSPPNYFGLVRALTAEGVRPRVVVIEVNQKVFNPADAAYATLHPAVIALARPLLNEKDRTALSVPVPAQNARARLNAALTSASLLYAMRTDIRETLYGDVDPVPTQKVTAAMYEGTYDLSALDRNNMGVRYLAATLDLLRRHNIPAVAFLTPTNHVLLHDYIDSAAYRANGAYLKRVLRTSGAVVLDLDAAFPASQFLDESHLTAEGQRKLKNILARTLRYEPSDST